MPKNNDTKIRDYLRSFEDGCTINELSDGLGINLETVRGQLLRMPDSYIDRWRPAPRGQYAAVWCVVVPPEDCPRPEARRT